MNNILLCGFMGCGKTTVGRLYARQTGMEYIDLDAEIERDAGMTIPAIFEREGEQAFRDREHAALAVLARRIRCVVSTGGGAMTFSRNVAAIDPADRCIFLDAPFEVCYARIKYSDRPLVRANTPDELLKLFEKRRAAYRAAASLVIDASGSSEQVAQILTEVCKNACL